MDYHVIVIGSKGATKKRGFSKAAKMVGGAAVTDEFTPEFQASRFSDVVSLLHSP